MLNVINFQKKRTKCDGFSIIETLIALSIFTIGILAGATLVLSSIGENGSARRITEATALAEDRLEQLMALPYDDIDYGSDTTGHIFEGMVSFNGLENLPVTFMIGYNFLNDGDNSIYMELGYSFSIFDVFVGAGNGLYLWGDGDFGIVNLGISASKQVRITEQFALPLSASLITNPEAGHIHLVFGVSF